MAPDIRSRTGHPVLKSAAREDLGPPKSGQPRVHGRQRFFAPFRAGGHGIGPPVAGAPPRSNLRAEASALPPSRGGPRAPTFARAAGASAARNPRTRVARETFPAQPSSGCTRDGSPPSLRGLPRHRGRDSCCGPPRDSPGAEDESGAGHDASPSKWSCPDNLNLRGVQFTIRRCPLVHVLRQRSRVGRSASPSKWNCPNSLNLRFTIRQAWCLTRLPEG